MLMFVFVMIYLYVALAMPSFVHEGLYVRLQKLRMISYPVQHLSEIPFWLKNNVPLLLISSMLLREILKNKTSPRKVDSTDKPKPCTIKTIRNIK